MDLIQSITEEYKKTDIPEFSVGDTVRVSIKVREGNKERIQVFEGFVAVRDQDVEAGLLTPTETTRIGEMGKSPISLSGEEI